MPINIQSQTDRELLVLTAQTVNEINEVKLPNIEAKLDKIGDRSEANRESIIKLEKTNSDGCNSFRISNKTIVGIGGGIFTMLVSVLYVIGLNIGWW